MIGRIRWAGVLLIGAAAFAPCLSALARPASSSGSSSSSTSSTSLTWEEAFPVNPAKREVYLDAHYVGSDGANHRLQVWRRGTEFLHRRTDEKLDLYLQKADGQADYSYRLFDHARHVLIGVNRNHLYRIGVFSDWFGLAHILDRPKTKFSVRADKPLAGEQRADCAWRVIAREDGSARDESRVCWSSQWGIPLVIRSSGAGDGKGAWKTNFSIDRVDDHGISADAMVLPAKPDDYAYFDAGKEISPEEGD